MIIFTILKWIFIAVLIAACIPISAETKYTATETTVLIKWLFIKYTVYPFPPQTEETEINKEKKPKKPKTDKSLKKPKTKDEDILKYLHLISPMLNSIKKPLSYLFKTIKINIVDFVWAISAENACETAINYGKYSGLFWIFYGIICRVFTVKHKNINIYPNFLSEESSFETFVKIHLIPIATLIIVIWMGISVLITFIKNKGANKNEPTSN